MRKPSVAFEILRAIVQVLAIGTLAAPTVRAQHAEDLLIASSAAGGGALVVDFDFADKIVATPGVLPGFFSTTEPGFDAIDDAEDGRFPLADGTLVRLAITAIDAGAQLQIGGTTLDGPGEVAVIGTMPDLHVHPQWQLVLDEGVTGDFTIAFRLTADGGAYADSQVYVAVVTNVEEPASTATPTPTPTATPGGARLCGDADGNGLVTVTDGVNVLRAAAELPSACNDPAPCDVDGNGQVTVTDGVNVLRAAAELPAELQCFDLE